MGYDAGEEFHYRLASAVAAAWRDFFEPAGFGPVPDEIRYYCCAQFFVTKDRLVRHPRSFYLKVRA